jgi:hypothetical protein
MRQATPQGALVRYSFENLCLKIDAGPRRSAKDAIPLAVPDRLRYLIKAAIEVARACRLSGAEIAAILRDIAEREEAKHARH